MELSPTALALLGLVLAAWTAGAVWLVVGSLNRARAAKSARATVRRLSRMIDDAPAVPLLVRSDGRIEGRDLRHPVDERLVVQPLHIVPVDLVALRIGKPPRFAFETRNVARSCAGP